MLRLLSPKVQRRKYFWKPSKPCHVVLIRKLSLSTLRWVPICQGFSDFLRFLHPFVLAKLASSSIRVKHVILGITFLPFILGRLGPGFHDITWLPVFVTLLIGYMLFGHLLRAFGSSYIYVSQPSQLTLLYSCSPYRVSLAQGLHWRSSKNRGKNISIGRFLLQPH